MFDTGIPAGKLGFEIISGSSDAGLKQAIETFQEIIQKQGNTTLD